MSSFAVLLSLFIVGLAAPQSPASALDGVWEGTMTNVPFGKCSWKGAPEDVRVVLRSSGDGKSGRGVLLVKPIPPGVGVTLSIEWKGPSP
jgi:hypothetical protein